MNPSVEKMWLEWTVFDTGAKNTETQKTNDTEQLDFSAKNTWLKAAQQENSEVWNRVLNSIDPEWKLKTEAEKKIKEVLDKEVLDKNNPEKVKSALMRDNMNPDTVDGYVDRLKDKITENNGSLMSKEDVNNAREELNQEIYNERIAEISKNIVWADWKELMISELDVIKTENPVLMKMEDGLAEDIIWVYWVDSMKDYLPLLEELGKKWEMPKTLKEFDSFMNEHSDVLTLSNDSTKEEISKNMDKYAEIVKNNPNDAEAVTIFNFLSKIFWDSTWNGLNYWNWWWVLPDWLDKLPPSIEKVLKVATSQIGVSEHWGWADKYLQELWHNRISKWDENAWCAGFVNWVLMKSWMEHSSSLSSQDFINWHWKWHVWFKIWNQLLWWNQWDQVSLKGFNASAVKWYVMPGEPNEIFRRWDAWFDQNKIPDWAICVFSRWKGNS